ncbi:hypothetical protein AB0J90_10915 [Micromonospora sp. NPDC049523]|uniref:hypothetical protein n=1 Tax=Micromonospora sp. NPDC049523 TaxID=3155921 RepID=UPI0034203608
MASNVEAKIIATIESRARHRPGIERIRTAYEVMVGRLTELQLLADEVLREVHRHPGRPEYAGLAGDLSALLFGPGSLETLVPSAVEFGGQLGVVHARVHRETVNIGVLGRTRAGKSTILRGITGQGRNVIPSSTDFPTTAARTRIYHSPDRQEAVISLRTWEAFRDEYLRPLHQGAGLGPVPATPEEFAARSYPKAVDTEASPDRNADTSDKVRAQPFLDKINKAQESFADYRSMLLGERRTMTVPLAQLRPFVAYPERGRGDKRLYHAVRDVHIYCPFRQVDRARVALVDLPGANEAGLDIDRHFLNDLNNDVDLLMCVKKPNQDSVHYGDDDFQILQLGQDAGHDVRLADFLVMVVNRDMSLAESSFRNAFAEVEQVTRSQGITTLECNAADETSVQDRVLLPVLGHLADRLAGMDAMVITAMRRRLDEIVSATRTVVGRLDHQVKRWRQTLPDEDDQVRALSYELRNTLGQALFELQDAYADAVRQENPIEQIELAIGTAEEQVRKWTEEGFGRGQHAEWESRAIAGLTVEPFREYERQFNRARQEITRQFQLVDASLHAAVEKLWADVAAVLRTQLSSELVPEGSDALPRLLSSIDHLKVPAFKQAAERLASLQRDYGSLFLRVATPIIIKVDLGRWKGRLVGAGPDDPDPAPPSNARADRSGGRSSRAERPSSRAERASSRADREPDNDDEWWLSYDKPTGGVGEQAPRPPDEPSRPSAGERSSPAGNGSYAPGPWSGRPAQEVHNLESMLREVIEDTVAELVKDLRRESLSIAQVLAATLWVFADGAGRTPDGEFEYQRICKPYRTKIWPGVFDGTVALMSDRIVALDDGSRGLDESVTALDQALVSSTAG